jgi:hypothetical protein
LKAEQENHLGYEPYHKEGKSKDNSRNGSSKKTLKTSSGEVEIEVPRDRKGTFEPQFIQKHQSFDPDLEKRVTSMYARGMSTRDIGQQLQEFYGTEVSPALISKITDKVLEGVQAWQVRPLDDVYAVVFMDAIFYKIRQDAKVITKAAYTCMGINLRGQVDVLGTCLADGTERSQGARREGHPDRLRGRPQGFSGGDRKCISAHPGSALRRSPNPHLAAILRLEVPQRVFERSEGSLPGDNPRSCRDKSPQARREVVT